MLKKNKKTTCKVLNSSRVKVISFFFLAFLISSGFHCNLVKASPPPVTIQSTSIFANQLPDGSVKTIFYLALSGPSPADINSITVSGPSGSVNLAPMTNYWQRCLSYAASLNFIAQDGIYRFTVRDAAGNESASDRTFIFSREVPGIEESSRLPADQSCTGSTTPTISFTSTGKDLWYHVQILDYNEKMIVYGSLKTEATSITVPEGFLQPDTLYKWYVKSYDANGDSARQSETFTFYTGADGPALMGNGLVVNLESPTYQAMWFGLKNLQISPWEVDEINVTDPIGNRYPLNDFSIYRNQSLYFSKNIGSPYPLEDGEYQFTVALSDGTELSNTTAFTRNPLPIPAAAGLKPSNNAYFNSDRFTLSWDPVFDPNQPERIYYYKIKIYDINTNISCYESETTTATSITIPVSGNLSVGQSYYWRLSVLDDPSAPNNQSFSSGAIADLKLFTIADRPVSANFSATSPGDGLTVGFTDQAQGNAVAWHWDFGDGSESDARNPEHTFAEPNLFYPVTLEVSSPYGSDKATKYYHSTSGLLDYPAPNIIDAGIYSINQNSSVFFVEFSGPGPEDIATCSVEGPAGSFPLTLSRHAWTHGLIYEAEYEFIPAGGTYTFTVIDQAGRNATITREFSFSDATPAAVKNGCLPIDGSYTGTTEPTLNAPAVSEGYWYRFMIMDYTRKMLVYSGDWISGSSLTIPEGFLQPYTAYEWFYQIADADLNNLQQSESSWFYTGNSEEAANLDKMVVTDFNSAGYKLTWIGTSENNIAPWNIESLRVVSPQDIGIELSNITSYRDKPMYYNCLTGGINYLNDGTYNLELTANNGSGAENSVEKINNPLPAIDEDSLCPAAGSYCDDRKIVFNWAPLHDPLQPERVYYYRIRIYDVSGQISCYDTPLPLTTDSHFTVPLSGNLCPGNSYYWQLVVYDGDTIEAPPRNMILSDKRRLTLTPTPEEVIFSSTPGEDPLTLTFNNQSVGKILWWVWNFGDGQSSSAWNPVHTYANPGRYQVTLEIFNQFGVSTSQTAQHSAGGGDILVDWEQSCNNHPFYNSVYAGYQQAAADAYPERNLLLRAGSFNSAEDHDLIFDNNLTINLRGGWNQAFILQEGVSTIAGSLTLSDGCTIVDGIILAGAD